MYSHILCVGDHKIIHLGPPLHHLWCSLTMNLWFLMIACIPDDLFFLNDRAKICQRPNKDYHWQISKHYAEFVVDHPTYKIFNLLNLILSFKVFSPKPNRLLTLFKKNSQFYCEENMIRQVNTEEERCPVCTFACP